MKLEKIALIVDYAFMYVQIKDVKNHFYKWKYLVGSSLQVCNAWSKNESIRHFSSSGGVIITPIYELLKNERYEPAFVVDSFSYDNYVQTTLVDKCERIIDFSDERYLTAKSRYVPIGNHNAIKYMIYHQKSRIIIVASPCAI